MFAVRSKRRAAWAPVVAAVLAFGAAGCSHPERSPEQRAADLVNVIDGEIGVIFPPPFRIISATNIPCEDSVAPYVKLQLGLPPHEDVTAIDAAFARAGWRRTPGEQTWAGRIASQDAFGYYQDPTPDAATVYVQAGPMDMCTGS